MVTTTVLMPVYNGGKYLKEAIDSVLKQTYGDFEFLIINDGSTDQSGDIIKNCADGRIKYLSNKTNRGIPYTLNRGIRLAKGKYVVLMHADDVSLPRRVEKLVNFMEKRREIDICGSGVYLLRKGKTDKVIYPQTNGVSKARLLFRTSFAHPAVIIRKMRLIDNKLWYSEEHRGTSLEDYDLWTRSCWKLRLGNVPECLLVYRVHDQQHSQRAKEKKMYLNVIRKNFLDRSGLPYSQSQLAVHLKIALSDFSTREDFLDQAESWLKVLSQENMLYKVFEKSALDRVLSEQWFVICNRFVLSGKSTVVKRYFTSSLWSLGISNWKYHLRLLLNAYG